MSQTAPTDDKKSLKIEVSTSVVATVEGFKKVESELRKCVTNLLDTACRSVQKSSAKCTLHDEQVIGVSGSFSLSLTVDVIEAAAQEG